MSYKDWNDRRSFSDLRGLTLASIDREDEKITFHTKCGRTFEMYHEQDCCESVYIESVVGDLDDLIGEDLLLADESSSPQEQRNDYGDSGTWTFYRLATRKGFVDIRWLGQSNGYYSESVNFYEVTKKEGE